MYMEKGLDTGDMLFKDTVTIEQSDNFEDVHDKLGRCGAALIIKTLSAIEDGSAVRESQDDSLATYAAKITKETCLVDFGADAQSVHDLIRGLSPIPLAFTHTPDGKLLKIISASLESADGSLGTPGQIISVEDGICVACGRGSVRLCRVLPEGKSRMSAQDFVRGRRVSLGDILK